MNFEFTAIFLNDQQIISPKDASAAIIVTKEEQVLLQLRDNKEGIFFPNHWGFFGGANEDREDMLQSLKRELEEEICITFDNGQIEEFIQMDLGFSAAGQTVQRKFFIVSIEEYQIENIQLNEGKDCKFFSRNESLAIPNFTPYDRFALWAYFNYHRVNLNLA